MRGRSAKKPTGWRFDELPSGEHARHVAIIMDGNRRWASARGLPGIAGHIQGVEAIKPIVRIAPDHGDAAALGVQLPSQRAADAAAGTGDKGDRSHGVCSDGEGSWGQRGALS